MYYSTTPPRPLPMTVPQGPPNPPVANMSSAQNSHGTPIIVQSQPIEMATSTQPIQVPQQPTATPMQPAEPRQRRKTAAIKIIDPNTGNEVDLKSSLQAPPVRLS